MACLQALCSGLSTGFVQWPISRLGAVACLQVVCSGVICRPRSDSWLVGAEAPCHWGGGKATDTVSLSEAGSEVAIRSRITERRTLSHHLYEGQG